MTKVEVTKKGKHIVDVVLDGHIGYGVEGEDIVCAALSSVVQTAALGLFRVAGLDVRLECDDGSGHFAIHVPVELSAEDRLKADLILDTMLLGVADLNEGYSDFIELEVK